MLERLGDRLDLSSGIAWCAAGMVALAAGTWAPWVRFTYDYRGTISGTQYHDSNVMLAISAAVAVLTVVAMWRPSGRVLPWLIAGLGVTAFVVALLDILNVTPRVTTFDEVDASIHRGPSSLVIHAGWGLYLCRGWRDRHHDRSRPGRNESVP